MRRLSILWGITVLIISLVGVWGCSVDNDDDNPAGPGDGTELEGNEFVEDFLGDEAIQMAQSQAMLSLELADGIITPSGAPSRFKPYANTSDSISIVIGSQVIEGDWFVMSVTATITNENDLGGTDTVYFTGTDSLRFENAGGYTTTPDSNITGLDARSHHNARIISNSDSVIAGSHNAFEFSMQPDDDILVGATAHDTLSLYVSNDTASCEFTAATNQTWTDALFTSAVIENDECPPSGTIGLNSSVSAECANDNTSVNVNGSWLISVTFNDGLATVSYTSGDNQWSVTDTCGTGGGGGELIADSAYIAEFENHVDGDTRNGLGNSIMATLSFLAIFDTTLHPFGDGELFIDPESVTYEYDAGWFIFTFDIYDTLSFYSYGGSDSILVTEYDYISGIDSVRIFDNGIAQANPTSSADSIEARTNYTYSAHNTLEEQVAVKSRHYCYITGTPWGGDTYVINANGTDSTLGYFQQYSGDAVCTLTVNSMNIFSNVAVDLSTFTGEGDGCPSSGAEITYSTIGFSCQSGTGDLDYNGIWNISTIFNGSTSTTTYSHNGWSILIHWSCGGGAVGRPDGFLSGPTRF